MTRMSNRDIRAARKAKEQAKTGWPPGLLQDDSRDLSKWLSSQPDARLRVREHCEEIVATRSQIEALELLTQNAEELGLYDDPLPLSDGTQADPREPWPISIDERK